MEPLDTENCFCSQWTEYPAISQKKYDELRKWIIEQINSGCTKEIPIKWNFGTRISWQIAQGYSPYRMPYTDNEHWYECTKCKKQWRLVKPDAPMLGAFEIINEND